MAVADRDLPTRALVVEPVWIEEILAGRKTWELRGQNCHLRGAVALAARGKLLGEVTFEQAMMVGERDAGGTLQAPQGRERDFLALPENVAQHRVENFTALPYSRVWAWVMSHPVRYPSPVPYRHPLGAVKFVDLTRAGVLLKVNAELPSGASSAASSTAAAQPVKRRRTLRRPAAAEGDASGRQQADSEV